MTEADGAPVLLISPSDCSSASYTFVPYLNSGGFASAALMSDALVVNGCTTLTSPLKVTTAIDSFGFAPAANARAAANAPALGFPSIVSDSSIASTTAEAALAVPWRTTETPGTVCPF